MLVQGRAGGAAQWRNDRNLLRFELDQKRLFVLKSVRAPAAGPIKFRHDPASVLQLGLVHAIDVAGQRPT